MSECCRNPQIPSSVKRYKQTRGPTGIGFVCIISQGEWVCLENCVSFGYQLNSVKSKLYINSIYCYQCHLQCPFRMRRGGVRQGLSIEYVGTVRTLIALDHVTSVISILLFNLRTD